METKKAQTDPISLKQKLEETKDGVKGAPAPSFTFYEKETFMQAAPTQTQKEEKETVKTPPKETPEVSYQENQGNQEEAPEAVEKTQEKGEESDDWWVEDSGKGSGTDSAEEGAESSEDKDLL